MHACQEPLLHCTLYHACMSRAPIVLHIDHACMSRAPIALYIIPCMHVKSPYCTAHRPCMHVKSPYCTAHRPCMHVKNRYCTASGVVALSDRVCSACAHLLLIVLQERNDDTGNSTCSTIDLHARGRIHTHTISY